MSDAQLIADEWKRQIDAMVPLMERDRRHGRRIRVKLYVSAEVASPGYVALPAGIDKVPTQV